MITSMRPRCQQEHHKRQYRLRWPVLDRSSKCQWFVAVGQKVGRHPTPWVLCNAWYIHWHSCRSWLRFRSPPWGVSQLGRRRLFSRVSVPVIVWTCRHNQRTVYITWSVKRLASGLCLAHSRNVLHLRNQTDIYLAVRRIFRNSF